MPASAARLRHGTRCRPLLTATLAACGVAVGHEVARGFVLGGVVRPPHLGGRGHKSIITRQAAEYVELSASSGLSGFQGSDWSLWTTFAIFVVSLPGVYSTVQRTGQAKFVEKTYVMPGTGAGGLEMRSIAGGVVAYFKGLNYAMENSPQSGKIRFTGNMQGSLSQALYLVGCVLGALISLGIVLQAIAPEGPFGLGSNFWYLPIIASPYAGWYYWGRAFRRDVVELQLEMSEDLETTTLSAIGDKETIEALQQGVRFQSPEGRLYQLMERGMEYQPGMFESNDNKVVIKEKEPMEAAAA